VDEFIPGEDPNVIVTRSHSKIDVQAGKTWGNKHLAYTGRYVQVWRFVDGKVKSFEEYYDTALLNSKYGA
jgi:ketosteroid isomerase-like protein